jgi:hypothetical protein
LVAVKVQVPEPRYLCVADGVGGLAIPHLDADGFVARIRQRADSDEADEDGSADDDAAAASDECDECSDGEGEDPGFRGKLMS